METRTGGELVPGTQVPIPWVPGQGPLFCASPCVSLVPAQCLRSRQGAQLLQEFTVKTDLGVALADGADRKWVALPLSQSVQDNRLCSKEAQGFPIFGSELGKRPGEEEPLSHGPCPPSRPSLVLLARFLPPPFPGSRMCLSYIEPRKRHKPLCWFPLGIAGMRWHFHKGLP